MPLIEDILKGGPALAIGLGLVALAVPVVFPTLRPEWAAAVKAGAKLYFEAEGGAEEDIIAGIAERAVDRLADAIAHETPAAASGIVGSYRARAHARSSRLCRNDRDRRARYEKHISKLRRAVSRRKAKAPPEQRGRWEAIVANLDSAR